MTGYDSAELKRLKERLADEFEIKDLGVLKYFLGMEFARSKEGIFVNQRKYVLDLLGEIGMLGCKIAETPMEPNTKLQPAKIKSIVNKVNLFVSYTTIYSIFCKYGWPIHAFA